VIEKTYPAPPEYDVFKRKVRELTGIDLDSYKFQIHRRVHMLMQRWGITDYDMFFKTLSQNGDKLREFLDYLTINVSEFFRNPNRWWELKDQIIPTLLRERNDKKLRIWSAGAATGEEPYSLGILSLECGLVIPPKVKASDIDAGALKKAEEGLYHKRQLVSVPPAWLERHFSPVDAETFRIKPSVKERVQFVRENLIEDKFEEGMDIILCRNVVIYFSPETKLKLYEKFFHALRPGGYLMVGSTEQIFEYRRLGFESAGPFLYRRPK
jgi:chemotaxis protein methyltransferase CheR